MENYSNFENILTEWMKEFFDYNKKDSETILKLMKDHEERENWFSSLIGFFYEHGLVDGNTFDKNKIPFMKNENDVLQINFLMGLIKYTSWVITFHF